MSAHNGAQNGWVTTETDYPKFVIHFVTLKKLTSDVTDLNILPGAWFLFTVYHGAFKPPFSEYYICVIVVAFTRMDYRICWRTR